MVQIVNFVVRQNSRGEAFYALILQSGIEMVKSNTTGRYYATAKQASVTSTFEEEQCRRLIGTEIPGSIKRVACEPREFTVPETGEVITISNRWEYAKEGETLEENVFHGEVAGKPEKQVAVQF
jgi:hypothetical protein